MRILFKVFPQDSHFNATIPLGRALRARGCEVIYAAYEERRAATESQGFSFHAQARDLLPKLVPPAPGFAPPSALRQAFAAWMARPRVMSDVIPADGFDDLIKEIQPDAVLVDSPYARYSVALLKHGIPFGILESMMRLDQRDDAPPPCSDFVPSENFFARTWSKTLWQWYRLKIRAMSAARMYPLPSPKHIETVLKRNRTPEVQIDYRRYFHVGIASQPEFILSPREFDFPGPIKPNQFYIGPSVDLERGETGYDFFFRERLAPLAARRAQGVPLVYVSLGSAAWRYPGIKTFFRRAIEAARGQRFSLVIALGLEVDPRIYHPLPANVVIFQRVPQLEILRQADAMITHGGMNTVTECILLNVPMLVYPGSHDLDQPGNAARVVYHKIGLKGILRQETAGAMREKLRALLTTPSYRENIRALSARIAASRAYNHGAETVLSALFPSDVSVAR